MEEQEIHYTQKIDYLKSTFEQTKKNIKKNSLDFA